MNNSYLVSGPTFETPSQKLYLLIMDELGRPIGLEPISHAAQPGGSMIVEGKGDWQSQKRDWHSPSQGQGEEILLPLVESALRRLYDPMYLGDHPLSQLRIVQAAIDAQGESACCLLRGNAVSALLTRAVEQLRPSGPVPGRTLIPERMWHPYLILYSAYIQDQHNVRIMSWLQISEGTFNRTRRRAVRAVTNTVGAMEWHTAKGI